LISLSPGYVMGVLLRRETTGATKIIRINKSIRKHLQIYLQIFM